MSCAPHNTKLYLLHTCSAQSHFWFLLRRGDREGEERGERERRREREKEEKEREEERRDKPSTEPSCLHKNLIVRQNMLVSSCKQAWVINTSLGTTICPLCPLSMLQIVKNATADTRSLTMLLFQNQKLRTYH